MSGTSKKTGSGPVLPPGSTPDPLADTAIVFEDGTVADASASPPVAIPESDPLLGQVLEERYRVSRLIGRGGMGRIYEAVHIGLGKRVAIKVLRADDEVHADDLTRFFHEAEITAQLNHPHIVAVSDRGTTPSGQPFFVMEYLEGRDLSDERELQGGILPLDRVARIVEQVCHAMAAAHKAGVLHRDLKPENIFLTNPEGEGDFVKVVDFGIALIRSTSAARVTKYGQTVGTVRYMSPEQARAASLDERADLYSLATIVYELLTGTPPFPGEEIVPLLQVKTSTSSPPSMRTIAAEIPKAIDEVVLRALSLDPGQRHATMTEFSQALQDAASVPDADDAVTPSLPSRPRLVTAPVAHVEPARAHTSKKAMRAAKAKRNRKLIIAGATLAVIMLMALLITALSKDESGEAAITPSPAVVPVQIYVPVAPVQIPEVAPPAPIEAVISAPPPDAGTPSRKLAKTGSKTRSKARALRKPSGLVRPPSRVTKTVGE